MTRPAKTGVSQINFEMPVELLDRLKAFAESRGQTLKYVMQRALARHLDHPPPLPIDPPLPPGEPDPPPGAKPPKSKPGRKPGGSP